MKPEEILIKHLSEGRPERAKKFLKLADHEKETSAMEEYAKQQAINFAKWLQESKYFWHHSKIGTLIHYHFDKVANDEYITEHSIEELFDEFLNENKQ